MVQTFKVVYNESCVFGYWNGRRLGKDIKKRIKGKENGIDELEIKLFTHLKMIEDVSLTWIIGLYSAFPKKTKYKITLVSKDTKHNYPLSYVFNNRNIMTKREIMRDYFDKPKLYYHVYDLTKANEEYFN